MGGGRLHRAAVLMRWLVLGPVWAWLLAFIAMPAAIVVALSFSQSAASVPPYDPLLTWDGWTPTLHLLGDNYAALVEDGFYLDAALQSLLVASASSLLCLLIGYPMALAIARAPERWRSLLLLLVMLPFWTGFLLRIVAWIGLLGDAGWINGGLLALGVQGAAEIVMRSGVQRVVQRHRRAPGLHQRPDLAGVADDVRVDHHVVMQPGPRRTRLAQSMADGGAAYPAVAVPGGAAAFDAQTVHHAVAGEPMISRRVGRPHRVRPDAAVRAVQRGRNGAGDAQIGQRVLLGHRRVHAGQVRVRPLHILGAGTIEPGDVGDPLGNRAAYGGLDGAGHDAFSRLPPSLGVFTVFTS